MLTNHRDTCRIVGLGVGWIATILPGRALAQHVYEFTRPQMGTVVAISVLANHEDAARGAAEQAFAKIESLEQILSDYRADSEVRRLAASNSSAYETPKPVSKALNEVLIAADQLSRRTDGAFDVTVGPLVRLWRRAGRKGQRPAEHRIAAALRSVGYRHLQLSVHPPQGPAVFLARPGMRIDLGGIAKGYIADRALETIRQAGYPVAMVDAGGDLALGASPPDQPGWRIGIAPWGRPEPDGDNAAAVKFVDLANCGVATSGDAARGVVIGKRRWSHVIDPRTGYPLTSPWAATVIAATCAVADGYASSAMVVGPEWIAQAPKDVQIMMAQRNGNEIEWVGSSHWGQPLHNQTESAVGRKDERHVWD
jgi:thiamine biosynthesis lipoprotein